MENTQRLRSVCSALKISSTRVEQWLSRGYLEGLEHNTVPGRARVLTKTDALRILALSELTDAGLPAAAVYREIRHLKAFHDDTAYLIMSRGKLMRLIPTSPLGRPPPSEDVGRLVDVTPGDFRTDIVRGRDLHALLSDPNRRFSIILNLDALEDRVDAAWK